MLLLGVTSTVLRVSYRNLSRWGRGRGEGRGGEAGEVEGGGKREEGERARWGGWDGEGEGRVEGKRERKEPAGKFTKYTKIRGGGYSPMYETLVCIEGIVSKSLATCTYELYTRHSKLGCHQEDIVEKGLR